MELDTDLLNAFVSAHPTDAARAIESMPHGDAAGVLADMPTGAAATVLPRLTPLTAAGVLALVPTERAALALSNTRRDTAAAVLRASRPEWRAELLEALGSEARRALEPLLRFSENTAGALMDPEIVSCVESSSVSSALERLRRSSRHALYYLYVVDDDQRLVGVVNLRELLEAPQGQAVGLVAKRSVQSLQARASSESIVRNPAWKRFHALPVVDSEARLLGVIRYEVARELEGRFLDSDLGDQGAETAAALGEIYGLGLRGLFEWAASVLVGSPESERGQR